MTFKIEKYRSSLGYELPAIEYTGENIEDIREFVKGDSRVGELAPVEGEPRMVVFGFQHDRNTGAVTEKYWEVVRPGKVLVQFSQATCPIYLAFEKSDLGFAV